MIARFESVSALGKIVHSPATAQGRVTTGLRNQAWRARRGVCRYSASAMRNIRQIPRDTSTLRSPPRRSRRSPDGFGVVYDQVLVRPPVRLGRKRELRIGRPGAGGSVLRQKMFPGAGPHGLHGSRVERPPHWRPTRAAGAGRAREAGRRDREARTPGSHRAPRASTRRPRSTLWRRAGWRSKHPDQRLLWTRGTSTECQGRPVADVTGSSAQRARAAHPIERTRARRCRHRGPPSGRSAAHDRGPRRPTAGVLFHRLPKTQDRDRPREGTHAATTNRTHRSC